MKRFKKCVLSFVTMGLILLCGNGLSAHAIEIQEQENAVGTSTLGDEESKADSQGNGNSTVASDMMSSYYDSFYENIEIDDLEEELQGINRRYGMNREISFEEIFTLLIEGKIDEAVKTTVTQFYGNITDEMIQNKELLIKLVLLVVVAAIFNTYSSIYQISFVGEQGFYVTYLMISILLMQSFQLIYGMAEETVHYLKELMECMLPALYMSIMLCSGLTTSHMVNTMFLWMLTMVEKLMLYIILPGVRIYFLIVILNQVSEIDRFSKLAGLIKQALQFVLKATVTGIIGLNVMKSILVPVYDNAKYNMLQKGLSVVPGGNSLSGLTTILVGAGVLIKNSVGITVVIILLLFGSIPLLEIMCFYIVYKLILAMVQPISNTRILAGIQGAADSTGILLRATATSIVLSVLSVAIVIMTTNLRLYVG
ncbi:MAG: stage III sporulation protein AE [Lachnospiraceae bacterium]|nr:stage III sporulation protein AE [Lachnospiraceae bacterium]